VGRCLLKTNFTRYDLTQRRRRCHDAGRGRLGGGELYEPDQTINPCEVSSYTQRCCVVGGCVALALRGRGSPSTQVKAGAAKAHGRTSAFQRDSENENSLF